MRVKPKGYLTFTVFVLGVAIMKSRDWLTAHNYAVRHHPCYIIVRTIYENDSPVRDDIIETERGFCAPCTKM